ncbi:hypothetical protein MN116_006441 [Schistosoma mekongi]|uniref:ATP-dependent RNA helicase n=1 Tax=Schistosoma mekongi TaxID=38744 RepID=A0AAE2D4I0_SCHME|nr:hypothetical protein MN116_006441 [Schistosoma mekongi]
MKLTLFSRVIDEADRVIVEEKQNWYHTLEDVLYYYTPSFNHNWSTITACKRSRPIPTVGYHYDRSGDITLQKILVSATLTHDPEPLKQFNLYFPILFTSNQIRHNCNNNTDTITNDSSNMHKNSFHIKKRVKSDNECDEVSNPVQSKLDENCMTSGVGQFVVPDSLEEFLVTAKSDIRVLFLVHLVRDKHKRRILCFTNTINCAKRLNILLSNFQGIQSKFLSSRLHPDKRQRILNLFNVGMCQILVCTDSMARGMDINDVECVVSYDVPISMKIYIHRIGRTARAGKKGIAYTLLSPNQFYHFKKDLKSVGRKKIKQIPFHQSKWSHFNAEYRTALSNYEKCVKISDKNKSVFIAKQENEYNVTSSEEIIRNDKKANSKHNKNKMFYCSSLMIHLLLITCAISILSYANPADTEPISIPAKNPQFNCNTTQRGFHLRLHCDFHDFSTDLLESCRLHVNLPAGFFIDPYELTSSQPTLNFSISKSESQQKLSASIKQFVNWLANSKKTTDHQHHHHSDESEQSINYNLVDIEAPEWLSEPLTFEFRINQLDRIVPRRAKSISSLDVPIHLRYHLPLTKSDDFSDTEYITEIKHPLLICPKGTSFSHINNQQSFTIVVPVPISSYLFFVMPITILILFIGVIYILLA